MVVYGDGTDVEFLKAENIEEIDSFIAVTENEKTNLISGMLANHLGAKQSIIHVVNTDYMPTIKEIGFGAVISKNLSTANSILRKLHSDISETSVETFYEIGLDAFELQPEEGSEITSKPLNKLNIPKDSIIAMINHHGKIGVAHGNSQLTEEDIALVFARPESRIKSIKCLFHEVKPILNVLGALLTLLGITMIVPILISYFSAGSDLLGLIKSSVVCILAGFPLWFLQNIKSL